MDDTAEFFSENSEEFDEKFISIEDMPEEFQVLLEEFLSEIDGNMILDVGCGTGMHTEYFVQQGFDATGIDIASEMLEYVRENRQGEFRKMDMKEPKFEEDSFDGIFCTGSIYFLPPEKMRTALEEFREIVKEDGELLIVFKIGSEIRKREESGLETEEYHIEEDKAKELVENSGFRIDLSNKNDHRYRDSKFLNILAEPKQT